MGKTSSPITSVASYVALIAQLANGNPGANGGAIAMSLGGLTLTNMAILTEEVGELARIMARKFGDQSFKPSDKDYNLADEMADVLWVLICLANQTGVDLTQALQKNFEKKNVRDATRHKENNKL